MLFAVSFVVLVLSAVGVKRPCDIYDAAGTPCVAAHSMVRALYGSYDGPLYVVRRVSDNKTKEIGVLTAGGFADSHAQDTFCTSFCRVHRIFDQSPKCNHLDTAPGGGAAHNPDKGVNATRHKLIVGGHPVYGAYFETGMGYRIENTSGVATGDEPESMYMVTGGKRFNDKCCFDYGNAEIDAKDHGKGTMEAIYWGTHEGGGSGEGPWVKADLENGCYPGKTMKNPKNTPIIADYVTAMVKGRAGGFALKGGDAQSGSLKTLYDGERPSKYNPMKKQGAIILGIGGDNSNHAIGTFYEGVMTTGFSSDATDNEIQANIVAVGYGR